MKVRLELDDKAYGMEFENWNDEELAHQIGELVEKTVMKHLGYIDGMAEIDEEES